MNLNPFSERFNCKIFEGIVFIQNNLINFSKILALSRVVVKN